MSIRLESLLSNERFGYRLGCINKHGFDFIRSDGSVHCGPLPQCAEDEVTIQNMQKDYTSLVKRFIDLLLEIIDKNGESGKFSLHMAAHLCANSINLERDEFLAIVTSNNKCIIMIGLFYNRFYG